MVCSNWVGYISNRYRLFGDIQLKRLWFSVRDKTIIYNNSLIGGTPINNFLVTPPLYGPQIEDNFLFHFHIKTIFLMSPSGLPLGKNCGGGSHYHPHPPPPHPPQWGIRGTFRQNDFLGLPPILMYSWSQ